MALIVPNEGELELLEKMLKNTSDTETYTLKLYQNNETPDLNSTASDFTEANFTGYTAAVIARGDWSAPSTNGSNKAQSTAPTQSWTCGATGNTIYGYYVIGTTSGAVLWAEKFPTARVLASGDILNMDPVFTLNSEN